MTNRICNSGRRKRDILLRATRTYGGESDTETGVLMNRKWCFALTTEQAVKDLIKDGCLVLKREGSARSKSTTGYATAKGRVLLKKLEQQKDKIMT